MASRTKDVRRRGGTKDEDGPERSAPAAERARPPKSRGRGRARRPILLSSRGGGPPLGRDFFENALGQMVIACACTTEEEPQVLVHLGDGTQVDVHRIVGTDDRFVVLMAYATGPGEDGIERTTDDLVIEAVPYDLCLRVTVGRVRKQSLRRFGFSLEPPQPLPQVGAPPEKKP